MLNRKRVIIIFCVVIILLLVAVIFSELQKKSAQVKQAENKVENIYIPDNENVETAPRDWEETENRKAVPSGIKVPELNEIIPDNLKNEIAVPSVALQVPSGSGSQLKLFQIKGEGGKFIPEKIIVRLGDNVNIRFTAVDKDYDIVFGGYELEQRAKKGETKALDFQALQDGRFPYYCPSCGGSATDFQGEIIVVK